jgi:ubiquinol-cytochrome c reductase cytochrome b subunit
MSVVDDSVQTREGGRTFFPDLFAVEALVALVMLAALTVVAVVIKAPLQAIASRDAAGFVPRPEWYFLWLFQLLKYFKGSLEVLGTALVPLVVIVLLLAVPFLDRREPKTRRLLGRTRPIRVVPRIIAVVAVVVVLTLTIVAASSNRGAATAPQPAPVWPPQSHVERTHTGFVVLPFGTETRRGIDVRVS